MSADPKNDTAAPTIRELTLDQVRALCIPSGFETDTVYVLDRTESDKGLTWHLTSRDTPYRKVYDSGDARSWLEPYFEEVPASRLRFLGAGPPDRVDGLVTWSQSHWNDTFWLIDIRVRPDVRRRGIGSALLRDLQNRARRRRVRGISVETQINNVPAVTFYRRHGFHLSGFNDHLYENDDLQHGDVALYLFWERS